VEKAHFTKIIYTDCERAAKVVPRQHVGRPGALRQELPANSEPLWLGFHNVDQDTYFAIEGYARRFGIAIGHEQVEALARKTGANEWSVTRGSRSGRVAWQLIQDLAGRSGRRIE
jgi:hypothetical protein